MTEILLTLIISVAFAWPLGRYLARLMRGDASRFDALFLPVERSLYRLLRVDAERGMDWRTYASAFIASNLAMAVFAWLIFMFQHRLPLNPDAVAGMSWDLALHTAVSFLTNTNQQHYSGQAQLSYLSQTVAIISLHVLSPMMALAVMSACLRGLFGGRCPERALEGEARDVGNYWVDLIRPSLRIFLPLSLLMSLLLTWQGVPSSYAGAQHAEMLDAESEMSAQIIPIGPVAAMVATKQLGANGGGWYGPNSAFPLENPTPLSNLFETVAILLLPMACVFMIGPFTGRPRLTGWTFAVMASLSVLMIGGALWSEQQPNVALSELAQPGPNLEGKELRFGAGPAALWATLTTQVNNGSVNAMHDSLNPAAGLIALSGMLLGCVWGGVGGGVIGFLVFVLLTHFLCGLMTGRTPEVFGRKLEVYEIRLLSLLLVLQAVTLLLAVALATGVANLAATSNPGFHGLSQVLYEYASAFGNNGSGFEGLGDASLWWNLSCVAVLILGRFPGLVIPLMVAGSLATKRVAPASNGTLKTESPVFAVATLATMLLVTLLSYLPVLVLGPVGEWLSLSGSP